MTGPLLVTAFGLLLARVVLVLISPTGRCGRCKGARVASRRFPPAWAAGWIPFAGCARRTGKCRRCKGHGRRPRFGARLVHHTFWTIFGDAVRDRIHASHQLRKEQINRKFTQGGEGDVQEQGRRRP